MVNSDLREVQRAINKRILQSNPGFRVHIERTFIHEGKILMICHDKKNLGVGKSCH